ncbi:MBL fold metallo-hydrolase [Bacillus nitratireducens]|uniref:MBL fold metallo-hydrolase n=1 Tax=Bacillus nitratireducens TaxID=2026193 RepID=UPI000BEE5C6D|nr:MBL fold metallo-hydrolase [Bacillus nitratireducens]PDY08344.1 Zn-dependent hydrolase [Bacillus cereus]PFJ51137.1 Zn-dependent hydrolase [Bacillus cereus]PFW11152.1 Zn-dependent hydrolase [Bacillus cereus]PGX04211.1 Zn-dependent hydrolase [Bacillus cereus]PGY07132.1 Zn-dependent hydrolase [Bacillus cereus]
MLLKYFYDEKLAHASYLIGCQKEGVAIVIDPGRYIEQYIEFAKKEGMEVIAAAETHIHADFLSGSRELFHLYNASLYVSDEGDSDWKYQYLNDGRYNLVREGTEFKVGHIKFNVMHTPGHTPESISFLVTDTSQNNYTNDKPIGIFTGDFIFVGDIGRPDLLETTVGIKDSAKIGAKQLFDSIQKIKLLPDYLQIWPTHGAGSACGKALGAIPTSTLGYEKMFNWAFQCNEEDNFVSTLLTGQPEPPKYFSLMKNLNKYGPPIRKKRDITVINTVEELQEVMRRVQQIVDIRDVEGFAAGHIEKSINIPYNNSFTTWCGWLLDYKTETLIILDEEKVKVEEVIRGFESIGLDNSITFAPLKVIQRFDRLESYKEKTSIELYPHIKGGSVRVLDVRSKKEWEEGHLHDAIHITLGNLFEKLDDVPKDCPIVLQCRTGLRSAIAASILQRAGIKEVVNLKGGFLAWKKAGLPYDTFNSKV